MTPEFLSLPESVGAFTRLKVLHFACFPFQTAELRAKNMEMPDRLPLPCGVEMTWITTLTTFGEGDLASASYPHQIRFSDLVWEAL